MTPSLESLETRSLLSGFTPHQFREAYGFAPHGGAGVTIAVVDAYNDPTILPDLAAYSRHFHLPAADLSVINLGSPGNTGGHEGWSVEEALDVEAIHAVLPGAKIVLVEAASALLTDLAIAEEYAASILGVDAVSNSWGAADDPYDGWGLAAYDSAFGANPHVVYAAAAGDASGPLSYPSSLPGVVSVGGVFLRRDRLGAFHDRPWLSYTAGSDNPSKTGPDVRMIGGAPGMQVFGSSGFGGPHWTHAWGTSLSCPLFAAAIGAVDEVREAKGEAPLGTTEVLAKLDGGTVTVPQLIDELA